ncbi:MAG TPA: alkaline phosphatase family protein, partial [Candidatus Hydrogenedentes bacterium]|nr:alkaline phosphatase family protein [Candidatus Hydrogenedentota bacterium]
VNSEMVLPESAQSAVESRFGGEPPEAMPQIAGNRRAIDALLQLGLDEHKADALFLWITDPDNTAHTKGVGTPETLAALKHVDEEVGRIFDSILAKGLADRYNILITSDHGFSTHSGPGNLNQLLVQGGVKKSLASTDVIVAEGAIYVDDSDTAKIAAIVELLQRTPWIGPVFTAARSPGETLGSIPGTLSFDSIAWNHARSGDILTCATWVDDANEAGWKGITAQSGTAGHGTSSPYDIHNTLIAVGPDIKEGIASEVPTANVDIAPTIAHILGISPAPTMDGRVMSEILRGGPSPSSISVTKKVDRTERKLENSTYQVELHRTLVEGRYYLDYTVTRRSIP